MAVQQAHWERTVASGQGPAYRIHTQRLVLRCWHPTDAPLLKAAIDASLEHLRPWLPWAQYEPTDLHRKILIFPFDALSQ
jgi:RimJ/RimL family protein N-acetyltransferase